VHSNSTIEHVGDWDEQQRMAREVQRVGRRYFVQTPNRNFPIEPHFLMPFFQFYPAAWQVWLITHYAVGHYPRLENPAAARELLAHTRMLSESQFRRLFAGAKIYREKYYGLVKSFVAIGESGGDTGVVQN
jgi:hypothetical protein